MKKILLFFSLLFISVIFSSCEIECRHENIIENTVKATCTDSGHTEVECIDCGYTYITRINDPKGHKFTKKILDATCTKDGYSEYVCECGYSYTSDYVSATGHKYKDTVTHPSCTNGGYTTHTCEVCSYSYISNHTDPKGHELDGYELAATCTEEGYTFYQCLECDYSYKTKFTSPLGHIISSVVTPPSCKAEGYTTYKCGNCDYSYRSDFTKPIDHVLSSTVTAPTCTEQGYTTFTCDGCDYSFITDYTEPTEHVFSELVTTPTCTEEGYTAFTCDACAFTFNSSYTSPVGHTYTKEIISEPDCTSSGEEKYTCTCGDTYSFVSPPLGHDFSRAVTMPTLSDMGYTVHTCKACEYQYTGNYTFYRDILKDAYAEGDEVLAKGIDISYHNYKVDGNGEYISLDWEAIKAAGVSYVIIRIGDAAIGSDPTFEKSYAEAKAAGLDVGFYFYTRAMNVEEIRLEAYLVQSALKGKIFEYPVYLDLEDESQKNIDPAILNEMCVEFFTILQRSGYYTGLYVNKDWLNTVIDKNSALSRFDIWYARYPTLTEGEEHIWNVDEDGKTLGMWQYSDAGMIDGIDTKFDLNFAYKDYPSIIKDGGFNGYDSDVKFHDSDRAFVWVIYDGSIKIRSKNDYFTTEGYDSDTDVIGYAAKGARFEVIERNDSYTAINYNGETAYITSNSVYISFEGLYIQ